MATLKRLGRLVFVISAVTVTQTPNMPSAIGFPPPVGTIAAEKLAPYGDAIRGLLQPGSGRGCCDLSDCRMVDVRGGSSGHYEALISPYDPETGDGFPGGPGKYLEVPTEVVLAPEKRNGLPSAVACWARWARRTNGFLCLAPGPDS
jgi:hypothetical protein